MATSVLRKGACVVVDVAACDAVQLAGDVSGSLRAWARDPEIYAVVADTRRLDPGTHVPDRSWRAVAEMLWRLDCFSKPTVTLMGEPTGPLALAMGLVGTHRVLAGRTGLRLDADLARIPWPPLARLAGAQFHLIALDAMDTLIAGLADAEPVDPLLDGAGSTMTAAEIERTPMSDAAREALAATGAASDLRALTLMLDARRSDPSPWTLPSRIELQSLRGT